MGGSPSGLRLDPDGPGLLLSPHWDDAVLNCWSELSGVQALTIMNVFAGTPPVGMLGRWDALTGAAESARRTRERRAEDAAALALAGRAAVDLGLLDNQYRADAPAPALEEIDALVAGELTGISRVYAPAGIAGHPDHTLVREYARRLHARGIPAVLYAELPYCVRHGWPGWVDGRTADPLLDVDVFWGEWLAGVAELPGLREAAVHRLEDEQAAGKLAAIRCYATQLPALEFAARELLADPEIHRYEVRWALRGT